jgi:hypothetical protein
MDGASWDEHHLAGPFDFSAAPFVEGLFLGDYQALSFSGSTFLPFYAAANGFIANNRTDIFAALLTTSAIIPSARQIGARRAQALPMTPEMGRVLTDSARRTLERRFAGRQTPPGPSP